MEFKAKKDLLAPSQSAEPVTKKHTILLVDDEMANLQLVSAILTPYYHVLMAQDGQAALDLIKNFSDPTHIQCIIADQRMPHLSGVEFLEQSIPIIPKAIRIILSAYTDLNVILQAINKGRIYHYLTKPLDPSDLLITIKRALETYDLEQAYLQNQAEHLARQEQMLQELQQADQLKDEFLANTSHELKTPLHGIIGLCESLLEPQALPLYPEQREHLNLVVQSAQRLVSLVNDILDFSQIKNRDIALNRKTVDVFRAFQLVEKLCAPLLSHKPLTFLIDLPTRPLYVDADENRLQQILVNLVTNAIKFTHEGTIRLGASQKGTQVHLWIQDTGIGIAADKQQHIFKPFFQADGTITRQYGGTGLGLAITRYLIEQHGGGLTLDSQEGQGSTFAFTLPVAELPNAPLKTGGENEKQQTSPPRLIHEIPSPLRHEEAPLSAWENDSSHPHILVVDDDPLNVKVLQDQLSRAGYAVETAVNGEQTLHTIEAQQAKGTLPDLVLLDVMMPLMDGYTVCQKLREQYSPLELPIILLTAKQQLADLERGFQVGANDYLSKPFYQRELLVRVNNALQHKQTLILSQENEKLRSENERFRSVESHLQHHENYLIQLLESSTEALLVVRKDGIILFANQACQQLLQYPPNDLLHQPLARLFPDKTNIPLHFLSLDHWGAETIQDTVAVTWQRGDGEPVSGEIQGAFLELDIDLFVFLLIPPSSVSPTDTRGDLLLIPQVMEHMNAQRQTLNTLLNQLGQPSSQAREPSLAMSPPSTTPVNPFAQMLVHVMRQTVDFWEACSLKTVVELAEESELWSITIDNGRLRVRTLEKYLDVKKLPHHPRWRTVVHAAYYVLEKYPEPTAQRQQLEADLAELLALVRQQKLTVSSK